MELIRYQYPNKMKHFNSWIDPFFSDVDISQLMSFDSNLTKSTLAVDFYDDEKNYYMCFELSGVERKDIDLKVENSLLTITGGHEESTKESKRSFKFNRSLSIPDDIQSDGIQAKLEHGLLTVTLPKKQDSKKKSIDIG